VLKGALAAAGVSGVPAHEPWMSVLSRQERALVGILYARYPRILTRVTILEMLPSLDHAHERQLRIVDTVVHKVRRKLGKDTVVTERGEGFRLGAELHEQLKNLGLALA
jgi:DNA-binding response OmpR family regulator